jgi:dihydroflavonol-4-reductase
MSQKVLITGATGFVGANLARKLLERGNQVCALVRKNADRGNLPIHAAFETREGDLRDLDSVKRAAQGCHEIYHVAADYRFWANDPNELYESNVTGTENVMLAAQAAGVQKIVHTSTVGTIGLKDQPHACNEETLPDPEQFAGHYKLSKLEAEKVALSFAKEGLPVVIVNPSTPIGAWDRKPTPTGKIIVDFVNGEMPAYVDTGLNFADVNDIAEGHILAAQKGRVGERYILGGHNLSMVEFLELVAKQGKAFGLTRAPEHAPSVRIPYGVAWLTGAMSTAWSDLVTHKEPKVALEAVKMSKRYMYFDSSKAVRELGYSVRTLDEAVTSAISWFFTQGYFNERKSYVSSI